MPIRTLAFGVVTKFLKSCRLSCLKYSGPVIRSSLNRINLGHSTSNSLNSKLNLPTILLASINFIGMHPLSKTHPYHDENEVKSKAESKICCILEEAKKRMRDQNYAEVKMLINNALNLVEETKTYTNLPEFYNLLLKITLKEGHFTDAEEMLVRFIDKLMQIGYNETDDQIVSYKLSLSRLYQTIGNSGMAEIGYLNCVNTQEDKIRMGSANRVSTLLYLRAMFWYARFLSDGGELDKANKYMTKALDFERGNNILETGELMGFLFHTAEILFRQHKYADSLINLTQCLEMCLQNEDEKSNLPVYLVKLGIVCYHLKMYDDSVYWCTKSLHFANIYGNDEVETEAKEYLQTLQTICRT